MISDRISIHDAEIIRQLFCDRTSASGLNELDYFRDELGCYRHLSKDMPKVIAAWDAMVAYIEAAEAGGE